MPSHVSTIARALAKQRAKQNQEEGRTRVVEPPKWSFYAQWNHSFYALFRNRCIQIWRGAAALKKNLHFLMRWLALKRLRRRRVILSIRVMPKKCVQCYDSSHSTKVIAERLLKSFVFYNFWRKQMAPWLISWRRCDDWWIMAREKNKARTRITIRTRCRRRPCIGKQNLILRESSLQDLVSQVSLVSPHTTFDVLVLCAQLLNEAGLHLSLLYVLFGSVRLHFCWLSIHLSSQAKKPTFPDLLSTKK